MSAGTGTNSNLLDLDILLRLPNANAFATAIGNQINQTIGVTTDGALLRYKEQINRQQAFVAQAEKTILQSQITAMKKGLGTKEIESVRDEFEKINEERQKAILKAAEITKQISETQDADLKERLGMEREALEAFAKMRDAEGKKQIALLRRMEIEQSRAIKGGAMAESMTKALEDGFNDISGGNLSQFSAKMSKALGSAFTAASALASQGADKAAAEGDTGKAEGLQSIAKILGGLAKFALVATALVGAFAAIFAMAAMLDSKMKEMNIAILDQVSAFDLLGESGETLAGTLENIRNVTTSFGLAMRTGATAEQLNGMVNAIAKFGTGLTDFNDSNQLTKDLEEIARYSRIAGEDFESMATSFATQADRMGASLDDVTDSFRSVLSSAIDSGFGVNRFQAAVFSATANSALYNKRLDETAGLLNLLSKSVGFEEGEQMMQETGDYYQNRGLSDRFVDVSTTNRGSVTEIYENELASMIRGMAPDLQAGLRTSLQEGLGALGVDAAGMDTEQLIMALQGRSSEERSSIMGGMGREQMVAANNMLDIINSLEGGTVDRARGLTSLGSAGAFAMRYNQGRQLIGNTRFNEMSMGQELYMEQQVGMSPQEIRRMRLVEQSFEAEMAGLRAASEGDTDLQAEYQGRGYSFEDGGIFREGRKIESIVDYIMAGGVGEEMLAEEEDEMVTMTRQIVDNTMKFEDIIANGVTSFLAQMFPVIQTISTNVMGILRFIFGANDDNKLANEDDVERARTTLQEQVRAGTMEVVALEKIQEMFGGGILGLEGIDASEEIASARSKIDSSRGGLNELGTVVSEGDMQEFLGEYLPESSTTSQAAQAELDRSIHREFGMGFTSVEEQEAEIRAMMARDPAKEIPQNGYDLPIAEETAETSEITAEEATAQTSIQEDQLSVQEDQENTLQDLLDAMFEGTAISALEGEGLLGGEARRIYSGIRGNQTAAQLGISQEDYNRFQRAAGVNDFIFQNVGGGARITPIHSQDQFVGMKPGGPVDMAMGNKGGGGNGNVTININGGNTSEIMRVMNQVLDRKGIYPSRPHRGK
jgi:hypothetical protein